MCTRTKQLFKFEQGSKLNVQGQSGDIKGISSSDVKDVWDAPLLSYQDFDAINNLIQRIPKWEDKYDLGDIKAQKEVIENPHWSEIKRIPLVLRSLSIYKLQGNVEAFYPKKALEMKAKIFQLYDMLIPKPEEIKGLSTDLKSNQGINEKFVDESVLPDVLYGLVINFLDPFEIARYNQGDSKYR